MATDHWDGAAGVVARAEPRAPVALIQSEPSGAQVEVDGEARGETPLQLALAIGPHRVVVTRAGWLSETRTLSIAADQTAPSLRVALTMPVHLDVETTPPGAELLVDGQRLEGVSPLRAEGLRPGVSRVVARLPGHRVLRRSVRVPTPDGRVSWVLVPLGMHVSIRAPGHQRVEIDRRRIGRARLGVGDHVVVITDEERASELKLRLSIAARTGAAPRPVTTFNLSARPAAEVRLDGRDLRFAPLNQVPLAEGAHTLELRFLDGVQQRIGLSLREETQAPR